MQTSHSSSFPPGLGGGAVVWGWGGGSLLPPVFPVLGGIGHLLTYYQPYHNIATLLEE